jgi:hypothetical protein
MMRVQVPDAGAGFRFKHTPYGVLVTPRHSKWAWTPQERLFRSAIVRDERIVSMGFPKFGGFRDEPSFMADAALVRKELESSGQLLLTEKRDGVLVIRSVIDGKVVFRTRRTHDAGVHADAIAAVAPDVLSDPSLEPDRSLLFELTVPEFRIVIAYDTPQLTLIGAVDHRDGRLADPVQVQRLGDHLALPTPQHETWTGSWKDLIADVSNREGVEGVVAVSADGQTLVKIKSKSYRALHEIRFVGEGRMLVELWERCGWTSMDEAHRWLDRHGASMDLVPGLAGRVQQLLNCSEQARQRTEQLDLLLLQCQMKAPGKDGAALSAAVDQAGTDSRQVLELLADGRHGAAEDRCQRQLVEALLDEWELEDASDVT